MSSVKKLAFSGAVWTFVGYGAAQVLRLVTNLILTHLLYPELFGLMSLANTFLMGLGLFSDLGLGPNIIYSPRGNEPVFLNTAWTLQVIRGLILWLCSILIAFPLAYFYHNQQLLWLIPVVGFTAVLDGFNSTSIYTLQRKVKIKPLTIFEIFVQVIGLIVMLIWAWLSRSIFALVGGILVSSILKMGLSYYLIDNYSNKWIWKPEIIKEMINFGRWIFISTAATFIAGQTDKIILAKLLSFQALGIYTVALTFAMLPQEIVDRMASRVTFPIIAKFAHLPREELRRKILAKRWLMLLPIGLLVVLLTCFGDVLILKLYDKRYVEAAWMLPILALGVWPHLLYQTGAETLVAVGKPQYMAYSQISKSIYVFPAYILGYYWLGLLGFVIMVAINDLILYVVVIYGLAKEKLNFLKQDFVSTLLMLSVIFLIVILRKLLGYGYPIDLLFVRT